jgi:predicted flap endonuclease-1-like 5' DNA nuclease
MDLIREYWWLIVIVVALVLAFVLLRPRQRVQLTDSVPVRPHMTLQKRPPEGRGLAGEHAAAASDVTGDILRAPVHRQLDGDKETHDDLCLIKGVGPKFADALHGLGFTRFEQIANLTPTEIERLDERLGSFRGRITRDRIAEQAAYLARGDTDGFEQRFGKL